MRHLLQFAAGPPLEGKAQKLVCHQQSPLVLILHKLYAIHKNIVSSSSKNRLQTLHTHIHKCHCFVSKIPVLHSHTYLSALSVLKKGLGLYSSKLITVVLGNIKHGVFLISSSHSIFPDVRVCHLTPDQSILQTLPKFANAASCKTNSTFLSICHIPERHSSSLGFMAPFSRGISPGVNVQPQNQQDQCAPSLWICVAGWIKGHIQTEATHVWMGKLGLVCLVLNEFFFGFSIALTIKKSHLKLVKHRL